MCRFHPQSIFARRMLYKEKHLELVHKSSHLLSGPGLQKVSYPSVWRACVAGRVARGLRNDQAVKQCIGKGQGKIWTGIILRYFSANCVATWDMEWHTATPSKAGIISCCVNSPKLNSCRCGHIDSWNKQHRAAGPLPTTPPRLPTLRPQFRTRSVAAPMVFIESKEKHHANLAWLYDLNIQIFLRFHVLEALLVSERPYII